MVVPIEFPRSLLREQSGRLELGRRVVSPGIGGSGVLPLIAMDGGGLWELDYGGVALTTPDLIRTWEAMAGISDGGVTPFVVPWCGCYENPVARDASGNLLRAPPDGIPFSDPVMFSDGAGFWQPMVTATAGSGTYALRATTFGIVVLVGDLLRGGEHFTIVHPTAGARLYRVVSIQLVAGASHIVTIRPPLREAVPANTPVDFDRPRCVMQLATSNAMDLTRELRRFGSPSVQFVEAFP